MTKRRWMLGMALAVWGSFWFGDRRWPRKNRFAWGCSSSCPVPWAGTENTGPQAVQLALDEINGQGGILGRKVEAIFEDDQMKVDRGVQVVKKFIDQDKVDFLIGPTSSAIALALADVVQEPKKILVLTQSATNSLTDAKFNPYLFSTLSNAMMHSRAGAYFLAPKPYKRWMNIGPDYAYGRESWNSFIGKLKELKPEVEVVGELWPKLMEKDFTPFIQKIIEAKPDAVWSSLWGNDAVNFIKQALPTGLFNTVKFAFTDGAALETLIPLGKGMPDGLFVAARYFFLTPDSPLNRSFVKTYFRTVQGISGLHGPGNLCRRLFPEGGHRTGRDHGDRESHRGD